MISCPILQNIESDDQISLPQVTDIVLEALEYLLNYNTSTVTTVGDSSEAGIPISSAHLALNSPAGTTIKKVAFANPRDRATKPYFAASEMADIVITDSNMASSHYPASGRTSQSISKHEV